MSKKKDDKKTTKEEEVKKEEQNVSSKKEEQDKSSKKEDAKEDPKKTSKKTPDKKEVKKDVPKKKKNIKTNLSLRTLVELVNNSNIHRKELLVLLDRKGYLGQFYDEEDKIENGLYVEPTISEVEFKKIIGE